MPNSLSLQVLFLAWETFSAPHLLMNYWLIKVNSHGPVNVKARAVLSEEMSANDTQLEAQTSQICFEKSVRRSPLLVICFIY